MKSSLLVMAAGMSSRFGKLKQIEPIYGSHCLLEYTLYDALKMGCEHFIFVLRSEVEGLCRERIIKHLEPFADCSICLQKNELDRKDYDHLVQGRTKLWGTGHAILSAKSEISSPFVVVNADDYYGREGIELAFNHLRNKDTAAVVGYVLENTLSRQGVVSRGLCKTDSSSRLAQIKEYFKVGWASGGKIYGEINNERQQIAPDTLVSLNLFSFQPIILELLESQFESFLRQQVPGVEKEFYLSENINQAIMQSHYIMDFIPTKSQWFGLTFREDKEEVAQKMCALVAQGVYPENLWDNKGLVP